MARTIEQIKNERLCERIIKEYGSCYNKVRGKRIYLKRHGERWE